MSQPRVLVVGASIAGPMAAYWFARAGAKVTVIERFPKLRTSGQNIDIRTTGVTVMRKIPGMEASVRANLVQMDGISLVDDNGVPYGIIRSTGNPEQQTLISEYEIDRGKLSRVLYDLSEDNKNVHYVFGEQIASMQQSSTDDGPVKVEFMNGLLPSSEYDLVVACDGASSRTRAMSLGCSARDYVHPVNLWAAYFTIPKDLIAGSRIGHGYNVAGGRFLSLNNDGVEPGNRVLLASIYPSNQRDATVPFREAMKNGEEALKRFVAKRFEGCGWKTTEIMAGMMDSEDFYANEMVQVKPPSLYKGRVALVGDAGHAPGPTGTGTTLAMTSAYVLAGEVCRHRDNLPAALKAYEERMRPIINDMSKIPPLALSFWAPQSDWAIRLRNTLFGIIAWSNLLEYAQRWLLGSATSTDKYGLPDYEWVA